MDKDIYTKIKREYDLKRQKEIDIANNKKRQIYNENPKLEELESKLNLLAITTARKILTSDEITKQIEQENLDKKLHTIQTKIDNELKKLGISKDELEPKFNCKICKDTGLIKEGNKISYCKCFMQKVINEIYSQSNIAKLDEENFQTFDIAYYSNKSDKKNYGIDNSPLENIEKIKKISMSFCDNIDSKEQKNLLFIGNTGLGKTFLSNCIANEVIKKGKTVVYQTAPILMDKILEYKFSNDKTGIQKDQYNKIFNVDLLIIDDLGTETMNNNKFTELFNIINTRLLQNKKMIISTNLTLNELYKEYDERVVSRLIGNFTICKFIGEEENYKYKLSIKIKKYGNINIDSKYVLRKFNKQ